MFNGWELISKMPGHVYWLDQHNVYQGCNDLQAKFLTLASREHIVGKRNSDLLPPEMANVYDKNNLAVMHTGVAKIFEETCVLPDQTQLTVLSHKSPLFDKEGKVIGLIGISIDITELKREQKILKEKFEQTDLPLEHILANMPGHVYWKNTEGVYLGCNDSQAQTLGISSGKEIIGKTDFNLPWGQELPKHYRENDLRIISTGNSETVEETAMLHDKKTIYLSCKTPLKNKNKEIVGIMGISFDITERKEMEEALKAAKEAAEAANNAKTEFLIHMHHDLCSPLSGIMNTARLLQTGVDAAKAEECTNGIIVTAQSLWAFVTDILHSVNASSGAVGAVYETFNLETTLNDIMIMNRLTADNKELEFDFYFDVTIPNALIGDSKRINRIVHELVVNALKYTQKGSVRLYASLAVKREREYIIKIEVEDTGPGIPTHQQEKIFQRLTRLNNDSEKTYKGIGLGLANTKDLVNELQGELYLESTVDKGTKFICLLPLRESLANYTAQDNAADKTSMRLLPRAFPVQPMPSAELAPQPFDGQKIHILIVEDQPCSAIALENTLGFFNCVTHVASNGEMAVLLFKAQHYDLVFMDLELPTLNGYDVTRRMRIYEAASQRQTPIAALTGAADSKTKRLCLDAGMNAVFLKPLLQEKAADILEAFVPDYVKA